MAAQGTLKLLLSDGKHFKEKVWRFPLAEELASSGLLVVGVKDDTAIVAACGIRSVLNVLVLYVERGLRGRGVGGQVLRATIESAGKRKLHFVTLSVSPGNVAAMHLYLQAGFKPIVVLEKPQLMVMVLPLTFVGKLAQVLLRLGSLLPNTMLAYVHAGLYKRTV